MKSRQLKIASLSTLSVLALVGCGQQLWEVFYPGPNNYYSYADDVRIAQSGPVVIGSTRDEQNNQSIFLAQYDTKGKFQWDFVVPDYLPAFRYDVQAEVMAVDASGGVFFVAFEHADATSTNHYSGSIQAIKIASDGTELWRKYITGQEVPLANVLIDQSNGNHYLYGFLGGRYALYAYDASGSLLWTFDIPAEAPGGLADELLGGAGGLGSSDGSSLQDYYDQQSAVINQSPVSRIIQKSATYAQLFHSLAVGLDTDSNVFVNTGTEIIKLNSSGVSLNSISETDLGGSIATMSVKGNGIGLLTNSENGVSATILDSSLAILKNDLVGSPGDLSKIKYLDMFDEQTLCFGISNYVENSQAEFSVGAFNVTQGLVGSISFDESLLGYNPVNLEATADRCYFLTLRSNAQDSLYSYTDVIDRNGSLINSISIKDFLSTSMSVDESALHLAGITGSYETNEGTTATLYKYKTK